MERLSFSGLTDGAIVLEFLGVVALPDLSLVNAITDIDIHPDGRQLAILTYGTSGAGQLFIWSAAIGEGTVNALTRDANRTLTAVSYTHLTLPTIYSV